MSEAEWGPDAASRRTFLASASSAAMAGGLVAGYGCLAAMAGKFLYPSEGRPLAWLFVAEVARLRVNEVFRFRTPAGQTVNVTRRGEGATPDDFLALSTVCPHLGCQVHWEAARSRFFCPCHNGAFDATGAGTEGPPADAKQSLPRFPLRIENGMVFIQAPIDTLA